MADREQGVPRAAPGFASEVTAPPSEAIRTDALTIRFGDLTAVDRLSIDVRAGEVFGMLGHNGAGKTTTVRLLNGILAPSSGEATVLGLSPVRDGPALRRRTGVLTEIPSLDERLTAEENLSFYGRLYDVPAAELPRRTGALLEELGLAERAHDRVGTFSKGMRQRLALARALLHDPELLFLDEPTSGLDPVAARQVHELVGRLRQRARTLLICTHNLVEAQRLCDRVAVLRAGRLLALGTPAELSAQHGAARVELEVAPPSVAATVAALRSAGYRGDNAGIGANTGAGARETPTGSMVVVHGAGRADVPALLATLATAGIAVYRAGAETATLEDVYHALVGDVEAG